MALKQPMARGRHLALISERSANESGPQSDVVPAPTQDDSELLAAVRDHDVSIASAVHDRVRPQVDRTLRRLLGRHYQDHDDLAQLALMEIVTSIDRFRGECSLDGWTSRVTAHVVYKHLRRRKIERRLFEVVEPDEVAAPLSHGAALVDRSVLHRIRTHLEALDENQSWTFLLHDVWGYDLKEISEITGVSVSAAQSRLVRGRRALHERLAADPSVTHLLDRFEVGT